MSNRPAAGGEKISYKPDFPHAPLILVNANRVDLETRFTLYGRNHNTNYC